MTTNSPLLRAVIVLKREYFKFIFGNKRINQLFDNQLVVGGHFIHLFELLQQLVVIERGQGFFAHAGDDYI